MVASTIFTALGCFGLLFFLFIVLPVVLVILLIVRAVERANERMASNRRAELLFEQQYMSLYLFNQRQFMQLHQQMQQNGNLPPPSAALPPANQKRQAQP